MNKGIKREQGQRAMDALFVGGKQLPTLVTFAMAPAAANVTEVTLKVCNVSGVPIAGSFAMDVWLSDSAVGLGLCAATPSGAVAVKAGTGTDLGDFTAKKAKRVVTKNDGTYVLSITDTAKSLVYIAASIAGIGHTAVSRKLVTGDYA